MDFVDLLAVAGAAFGIPAAIVTLIQRGQIKALRIKLTTINTMSSSGAGSTNTWITAERVEVVLPPDRLPEKQNPPATNP